MGRGVIKFVVKAVICLALCSETHNEISAVDTENLYRLFPSRKPQESIRESIKNQTDKQK